MITNDKGSIDTCGSSGQAQSSNGGPGPPEDAELDLWIEMEAPTCSPSGYWSEYAPRASDDELLRDRWEWTPTDAECRRVGPEWAFDGSAASALGVPGVPDFVFHDDDASADASLADTGPLLPAPVDLAGGGSASAKAGSCQYTFRVPYGPHTDGTMSTLGALHNFKVGEEVVVMPAVNPNGSQTIIPFGSLNGSVYRIFTGTSGQTAVVDGDGHALLYSKSGLPDYHDADPDLRARYFADPPLDLTAAASALNGIELNAAWNGSGFANGPWAGWIHLDIVGDAKAQCAAYLEGTVTSSTVKLSGDCLADYAGSTGVKVSASWTGSNWVGSAKFTPHALPSSTRTAYWSSSGQTNLADEFVGVGSGSHSEGGYNFTYDLQMRSAYMGSRRLMTKKEFLSWVVNQSSTTTGGLVNSTPLSSSTCKVKLKSVSL